MSKMEPTEFLNDRYAAMEERLAVSSRAWRAEEKTEKAFEETAAAAQGGGALANCRF